MRSGGVGASRPRCRDAHALDFLPRGTRAEPTNTETRGVCKNRRIPRLHGTHSREREALMNFCCDLVGGHLKRDRAETTESYGSPFV